jgi:hypothetical protein
MRHLLTLLHLAVVRDATVIRALAKIMDQEIQTSHNAGIATITHVVAHRRHQLRDEQVAAE